MIFVTNTFDTCESWEKTNVDSHQHQSDGKRNDELHNLLKSSPYFDPSKIQVAAVPTREWSATAQQALSDAQDAGSVNRQELCSMVPPILLTMDLVQTNGNNTNQETHIELKQKESFTLLDMAAAPGSKTLQIMDILRTGLTASCDRTMLIANDSNRKRLVTLSRRSRAVSGQASLVLNSSDGRYFPSLRKWGGYKLKFDRILADVPCSGDGTLRKLSTKEWAKWSVLTHLQLHKLQVRLLLRALQLVKKGGRAVYSTCSLDPIENEAVITSAIAQVGGPGAYRIVPLPDNFSLGPKTVTQPMRYSRGSSSWVVPDPSFSHQKPVFYRHYDEVPDTRKSKHILPSMFPPQSRIAYGESISNGGGESNGAVSKFSSNRTGMEDLDSKDEAKHDEDVPLLSSDDVSAFEAMLPNCCRILPQHMDSGGFFCAVIERSSPSFYAVCCPQQKGKADSEISNKYHGKIYRDVSSPRQLYRMIEPKKERGEEVFVEGHSTLEGASKWLGQHGAFVEGRSEVAIPVPESHNGVQADEQRPRLKKPKIDPTKNEEPRQPLYTPLFQKPNTQLVSEFCDFYGLPQGSLETQQAGVARFPVEDLVAIGGGAKAPLVTTCVSLDNGDISNASGEKTQGRQQKYFRLVLVSKEIQTLHAGAAKFNPMEAGLTICWIPIPGTAPTQVQSSEACHETTILGGDVKSPLSRNERSGRYGLADEAANLVGRCATKRVFDLSRKDVIQLLSESVLQDMKDMPCSMSAGGVIVRYTKTGKSRKLFLSCKLSFKNGSPQFELLTEVRMAKSWLRLLQAQEG